MLSLLLIGKKSLNYGGFPLAHTQKIRAAECQANKGLIVGLDFAFLSAQSRPQQDKCRICL